MPQRTTTGTRRLGRILLFSLVAWALVALGRAPREQAAGTVASEPATSTAPPRAFAPSRRARRRTPRRLAMSFAVSVLFFAGASLSAIAGDQAVGLLGEDEIPAVEATDEAAQVAPVEAAPVEAAPVEAVPAEPVPAEPVAEPAPAPAAENEELVAPGSTGREAAAARAEAAQAEAVPTEPVPAPAPVAPVTEEPAVAAEPEHAHGHTPAPATQPTTAPVARQVRQTRAPRVQRPAPAKPIVSTPAPRATALDPEATAPGVDATIWLHRTLPDPTPPSLRLSRAYVSRLVRLSRAAGADWSLVLGVLRAETSRPQAPARPTTISQTAGRLVELGARRHAWNAALALTGRTATSDRALALARYYRAIGVRGLVHGLRAEENQLAERVLADERVTIYGGGREDLAAGRVDVRVVAMIAYLAEAYGQVTVSSLISGHRLYSRPGVISAHVYGAAVDVAALGGVSILGHQAPGSVTERAVRDMLLLPAEIRPRQLISLIGMGGPSFALANHHDHIHVGF